MSEETITIKKESLWKYSTFILTALLIVVIFLYLSEDGTTTGNVVANDNALPQVQGAVEVSVDDDAVIGDKDAPVTIIEFSDYECPFCGRHFDQVYPSIKKNYVDTGKVKMVFRDFPLSFHPSAQKAAEAAECVREKGGDAAYWKMHDKLFSNQETLSVANYEKWAKELGQDISDCLASGKYYDEVQKDLAQGSAAGVQGTPAFFINGKLVSGAQPYTVFQQTIEAELSA